MSEPQFKNEDYRIDESLIKEGEPLETAVEHQEKVDLRGSGSTSFKKKKEVKSEEKPTLLDDYFEDDDLILAGEDEVLEKDAQSAIFEQLESVISWEIEGFYDENEEPKVGRALKKDPPMLHIRSSHGEEVNLLLTKELTGSLQETFEVIHKAYYGVQPKRDYSLFSKEGLRHGVQSLKDEAQEHPVRMAVITLLILFMVVSTVVVN